MGDYFSTTQEVLPEISAQMNLQNTLKCQVSHKKTGKR